MAEVLSISTRAELRRWYENNHASAKEMVIPCSKAKTDKPGIIRYLDAVEEALCFGWIDSSTYSKDGIFHQRFSPRRKNSEFSALNWARCQRLERLGLMTDAGRAAIPADIEQRLIPKEDIISALKEDPIVWENFRSFPPLYQSIRVWNIERSRKSPELFGRMLARLIEQTRAGKMYGDWNDGGRLSPCPVSEQENRHNT